MSDFMQIFRDIAARTPIPEPLEDIQEATPFPKCQKCDTFNVSMPDEICEQCTRKKEQGYEVLQLLGRLANGFQSDMGRRYHAVPFGEGSRGIALCGAKPSGRRSVGWTFTAGGHGKEVTCPRCLKVIEKRTQ